MDVSQINVQVGLENIYQLTETVGFLAKGHLSAKKLRTLPPEATYGPITCIKNNMVLFFSGGYGFHRVIGRRLTNFSISSACKA